MSETSDDSSNEMVDDIPAKSSNSFCERDTLPALLDGKFFKCVAHSSTSKKVVAECMICYPAVVKIKGSKRSTSNFLSHLKRKHGANYVEEYHIYAKIKKETKSSTFSTVSEPYQHSFETMSETSDNVLNSVTVNDIPSTSSGSSVCEEDNQLTLLDGKFFKYKADNSTSKTIVGECMVCYVNIRGSRHSTSNFLSHLRRKHGAKSVEEYQIYAKAKKIGKTKSSADFTVTEPLNISQNSFDTDIIKYFSHSMIPLKTIEDPYFIQMMNNTGISNYGIEVMSYRTLGHKIDSYHSEQIYELKNILQAVTYVCTIVHVWLGHKRSLFGVTAHWIDEENLNRKTVTLACREIHGIHSYGSSIAELINEVHGEYNLNHRNVVATVNGGNSNFLKSFTLFGIQLDSIRINYTESLGIVTPKEEYNNDEDLPPHSAPKEEATNIQLSENSYILYLCATADAGRILKETDKDGNSTLLSQLHKQTISKCNTLWNAIDHPKSAEIIQNILGETITRPIITRWNSLYDSLKQILGIKKKNIQLFRGLGLSNPFTESEFEYIKEFIVCSAPIAEALDVLQGENNMYYGILLPCLLSLRKKLDKLVNDCFYIYCGKLAKTYLESVNTRFSEYFCFSTTRAENAVIAALSYPRFKNKWITCVEPVNQHNLIKLFKDVISKEFNENSDFVATKKSNDNETENSFFEFESDSGSEIDFQQHQSLRAEFLISEFFAEKDKELKILHRYPEIKSVFIKYNTPLPSSAPVEGLLSHETMTNLSISHSSSDEMFEKRVVLKSNFNFKI